MAHYLMHTAMGVANIFNTDQVISEAEKVLQDVDFGDYTKDLLVAEFVNVMNTAFSSGELGSRKEPSVNEIRHIVAVAHILCKACSAPTSEWGSKS